MNVISDTVKVLFDCSYSLKLVIYNCCHPMKTSSNRSIRCRSNFGSKQEPWWSTLIKLTALIWFGLFLMSGYTAWFFKHFHLGLNGEMKSTITDKKKKKLSSMTTYGKINCKEISRKTLLRVIKQCFNSRKERNMFHVASYLTLTMATFSVELLYHLKLVY